MPVFQKGFTAIELIMYMGIFTILLVIFFQIFTSIFDVQLESQAANSVSQDGRFVLARFLYDMQRAQVVTIPASLGTQASSLQLTINSVSYTYSVSNGVLNLTNTSTGTTDALTTSNVTISNFHATRLNGTSGLDTVQIIFTLTSTTLQHGRTDSQAFQTTAGLRKQQ